MDCLTFASKETYRAYWTVELGLWTQVQARRRYCALCEAVISILLELSLDDRYDQASDVDVQSSTCMLGLLRDPQADEAYGQHGYSRISITLETTFSGAYRDGYSRDYVTEAFQVSPLPIPLAKRKFTSNWERLYRKNPLRTETIPIFPQVRLRTDCYDDHLLRKWLHTCDNKHGKICLPHSKSTIGKLRLVDVQRLAVVEFLGLGHGAVPPYVTLSWVWGTTKAQDGLTLATLTKASENNFLRGRDLPLTVADSIRLLKNLGERYLWVDLLCIIQDDENDQRLFIPAMGKIYSEARFTIVANSTLGAQDGLPGVRRGTRPRKQHVIKLNDLLMVSGLEPKCEHGTYERPVPPWQTRAWTLQEKLLSSRCLIFSSNQIHWECLEAAYCEETAFEHLSHGTYPALTKSLLSWDIMQNPPEQQLNPYQRFHRQYEGLVNQYNRRDLSFESDIVNAIQGILDTITLRIGIHFLWGHPCSLFEQSLLWSPVGVEKRDTDGVPTWSWFNYKYATVVDQVEDQFSGVTIRCFERTRPSPPEKQDTFQLKQISTENQYPTYLSQLVLSQSPARSVQTEDIPSARLVQTEDIQSALRAKIRASYHIIFWADTIDVIWIKHSRDILISRKDADAIPPYQDEDQEDEDLFLEVGEKATKRELAERAFAEAKSCRVIGNAILHKQYQQDQRNITCMVVRVLAKSERPIRRAMLIMINEDGIAKNVGQANVVSQVHEKLPWKQRLVVLG